jgi:hypothetical protein
LVGTVDDECGCSSGRLGAPPIGRCGSHTFSLLDSAARGIRVRRNLGAESEFGQIPGPVLAGVPMRSFAWGLQVKRIGSAA